MTSTCNRPDHNRVSHRDPHNLVTPCFELSDKCGIVDGIITARRWVEFETGLCVVSSTATKWLVVWNSSDCMREV